MRLHLILDHFDSIYPDASSSDFETTTVPAFANLAKAAAAHFTGKHVTYEIWNEPNTTRFWPPTPSATQYAALCKAAIAGLHRGDAAAKVTTAGIAEFDYSFLRSYLGAGGGVGANAIGIHPYRQGGAETVGRDLLWMRKIVSDSLSATTPVWDTEWGYSSSWYGGGHDGAARRVQAVFAARELLSAWSLGFPLVVYYDLRDDGTDATDFEDNFGLLDSAYADKPSMTAVRTLSAVARGRSLAGFVALEPTSLHAMRLDATADVVFAVWSEMPGSEVPLVVTGATQVIDVLGAPVSLTRTGAESWLMVREEDGPVYVTFAKGTSSSGVPTGTPSQGTGSIADAGVSDTGGQSGSVPAVADTAPTAAPAANDFTEARDAGLRRSESPSVSNANPSVSATSTSPAGCGCRAAPRRPAHEAPFFFLAAAALTRRAGRRRRRVVAGPHPV